MNLSIQPASEWAWNSKYRVGNEATPADTFDRVATALASVEDDPCAWLAPFRQALENGATPAGRILANAGAEAHKAGVSTINCTVSMKIEDSMEGIGRAVDEALQTLKGGSGIGYDFSTLRPSGAHVHGSGASTTGPLPFMDIFDSACKTVSSAGGRPRGTDGDDGRAPPRHHRVHHRQARGRPLHPLQLLRDDHPTALWTRSRTTPTGA